MTNYEERQKKNVKKTEHDGKNPDLIYKEKPSKGKNKKQKQKTGQTKTVNQP